MRSRRLQFVGAVLAFTFVWFCVRFPYEMLGAVEKVFGSPNQVDPLTLHLHGEFVESNLGTAVEPDGSITVRLIAQQFNFVPECILVPTDRLVRFRITSADAVHRFTISGTDHALEVVPGRVSESQFQFSRPGQYKTPCHEFCGAGHYDMRSRVIVLAGDQFPHPKPEERLGCASL
jgi:cytochrome c oxidase subunit II